MGCPFGWMGARSGRERERERGREGERERGRERETHLGTETVKTICLSSVGLRLAVRELPEGSLASLEVDRRRQRGSE